MKRTFIDFKKYCSFIMIEFKNAMDINKRLLLSKKIINEHPNSVPVILESLGSNRISLSKTKFILSKDLLVSTFIQQLAKDIILHLHSSETVFLFCQDNILIPTSLNINTIYQKYKDPDGFLYLSIMKENTFG